MFQDKTQSCTLSLDAVTDLLFRHSPLIEAAELLDV